MENILRRKVSRRVGLSTGLVAAGALGLFALPGLSEHVPVPDEAACCTSATAVGDAMIHASNGGDKDFFEVPAGPANALFLLSNYESMQQYAEYLPEVGDPAMTGCSDPALVAAMSWVDINSTDPKLNGSIPIDPDPDFNATSIQFFDPTKYYNSRGWRLALNGWDWPYSLEPDYRTTVGTTDVDQVCYPHTGWDPNSAIHKECRLCLQTRGWWRGKLHSDPSDPKLPNAARRKWVLSGRVLNVRPPKFVVARKVLKDVISTVDNLRMGVAIFGRDRGWYDPPEILQPLRPACDKSFPILVETELKRTEMLRSINRVTFNHYERSIGEALFGLGGYFSSQKVDQRWTNWFTNPLSPGFGWPGGWNGGTYKDPDTGMEGNSWGYASDEWHKPGQIWEGDGQEKSVCYACQASSVIVLTDGAPKFDNSVPVTKMMQLLVAAGARHPDGTPLAFDPSNPESNTNPGGVNYCDKFGATKEDCDYANWPTGLAKTNKNFMDDVAFFLANTDLRGDMEGEQNVRTYTIGYGDNSPMLQSIAMAGKGEFYRVNNPTELRTALMDAIDNIKEMSTSFGSANISGVQAGGMQSSAYVPRFIPRRKQPYEGHLYRFFFFNEFTQGCEPARAKSTSGDPRDLNGDKDCEDTFFLDKPAGLVVAPGTAVSIDSFTRNNIVQENVEGRWVKVATAKTNSDGRLEGGTPAEPFWDLSETLSARSASAACNPDNPLDPKGGRCIFTLIDRNQDGRFTDADNPPVPFDLAHGTQLQEYLLAAGDGFCVSLFARQKRVWTGTSEERHQCVNTLIRHVRGVDVFDYDGDSNTTEDRPCAENSSKSCKLADIFHSTPVVVDPPVEPFLCALGLSAQCVSTLYENFSGTVTSEQLCSSTGAGKPCYAPTPMSPPLGDATHKYGAYDMYRETNRKRERIVLVGSNGGMLHAVHAGTALSREKTGPLDDVYDLGTGQELWAFIPPDLLPKLGLMMNGHEYYVDGTPMVRDIWEDGSGSKAGVKEPEEFHTLAILSERSGGQRFVALDVTDPRAMLRTDGKPFRWMFPNACEPEAGAVGQSWANFAPKPPPIGPVRLAADNDRGWNERWIAFLNGGYSADLTRGRGVYMLDAWTGERLWSVEGRPGATATGDAYQDDVTHQMMPVVASPAMVDIGKAENVQTDMDGFFDTMVVGDMGGQVWTFRFHEPGKLGPDGRVTNWFGARSLEIDREDTSFGARRNAYKKTPFFHIASNVHQPDTGWLRSYLGTGDRQNLRDKEEISCGPENLLACVRQKCDVKAEFVADINGQLRTSVLEYDDGMLVKNTETRSGSMAPKCSSARMELTSLVIQCDKDTALGSVSYRYPALGAASSDTECYTSAGKWTCTVARLATDSHGDLNLGTDADLIPKNRYFGFHSYGGPQRRFKTAAEAVAFDKKRVTDVPFTCEGGVACSLVDVTIPDTAYDTYLDPKMGLVRYLPSSKLASLARGTSEGPGWFIGYKSLTEKTAAGSSVLGGVVFWPSFQPPSGSPASACKLSGAGDTGRSWQADVITGLPDQSEGFRLFDDKGKMLGYLPNKSRAVFAPPPEPASVISLSKTGGIRYQVAVTGAGEQPTTETLRVKGNVTPDVYWMVVPKNLHECRHVDDRACVN